MGSLLLYQLLSGFLKLHIKELNLLTQNRILLLQTYRRDFNLFFSFFNGLLKELHLFGEFFNFPWLLFIELFGGFVILLLG
jgi:hypothetical protein